MEWLSQNWAFVLILVAFAVAHLFGHGGHGGHGSGGSSHGRHDSSRDDPGRTHQH